jgi:phage baseplate assembly protein V
MRPAADNRAAAQLVRLGTVIAVDLAAARCRVRYGDPDSDDLAETGWIRWLAPRAGALRVWSPPSQGEQVILLCPDGQIGLGVAVPGIWWNDFPAPSSANIDLLEWNDGAKISYDPAAKALDLDLPAGATVRVLSPGGVTIEAAGGITLKGDVSIDGDLAVSGEVAVQGDVIGQGKSLSTHTHGGVQSGAAQTLPPT